MPLTTPSLDHLILFLPANPSTSLPSLPNFLTQNFTLSPGGHHADGFTSNTLILLADGCYIELICFLKSAEEVATHWWGPDKGFRGWRDWCLTTTSTTTPPSQNGATASGEALGGELYAQPIEGGRKRADGTDVKWRVTFPKGGPHGAQDIRGKIPFWCHDVTPRDVRVPVGSQPERARHECGVLGVREISVVVGESGEWEKMQKVYERVFGAEGTSTGDGGEVRWEMGRVRGLEGDDAGEKGASVVLRLARGEEERERVRERGFWFGDVVLVGRKEGKGRGERERLDGDGGEGVGGLCVEYV